jgi:hypothetical protein
MSYQFMHIETYSEAAKKVSGTAGHFNSATQVLGEALREPEYSKHVEEPGSVYKVGGTMPVRQLQEKRTSILDGLRETVTRKDGTTYRRKLRNDAATLYTEIHSHPMPAADLLSNKKAHGSDIREWINHALADFTDRMPDDIDWSAVMHSDEGFVHFHIIAINTHDPKLDANKLHAGKVAAATLRDELDKYPQNTSPALRLNEGHKLAEFYSATTALCRGRFCGPLLLCFLQAGKAPSLSNAKWLKRALEAARNRDRSTFNRHSGSEN